MYIRKSVIFIIVGVIASLVVTIGVLAATGTTDSSAVPGSTNSYTLADIYDRLDSGTAGSQSSFTEPGVAPGTGTMHTLDDIMGKAPAADDTNGAAAVDVMSGKTFWGLTSGEWGLKTGTRSGAPVPKTGDTYTDGSVTGEDGELQKGVAWPSPRFTVKNDGTVTDNLTGLIWLKNANCANTTRTWSTALSDLTQLNTVGTMNSNNCGDTSNGGSHQTDWRLPNVRELHSLIHHGVANPALPNTAGTGQWTEGDPFTAVQSSYYWSGTTRADNTSLAWRVDLYRGLTDNNNKVSNSHYVWPVRGGQ